MTESDTTTPAAALEQSLTELAKDMVAATSYANPEQTWQAQQDTREKMLGDAVAKHRQDIARVAGETGAVTKAAREAVHAYDLDVGKVDEARCAASWEAI